MERLNLIDNIIFDLGEVILDLDPRATVKAFNDLAGFDTSQHYSFAVQDHTFDNLETGKISEDEFRDKIRVYVGDSSDNEIDNAWNAMLLDIPKAKLEILESLKDKYFTFVLSNTNSIHIKWVDRFMQKNGLGNSLDRYFHHVYYSHLIGFRKPDPKAFSYILNKHDLDPSRTLFIDDREENIEAAIALGLKSCHLKKSDEFYELFTSFASK